MWKEVPKKKKNLRYHLQKTSFVEFSVLLQVCSFTTWEVETGEPRVQSQPLLNSRL